MMDVYRISPCRYNSDLSGTGAAMYGGRWNSKGVYVVYTSSTPSLALLESVVHLPAIPREKYCLATIKIPEDKILEIKEKDLPPDWAAYPAPVILKAIGDQFILENKFLAMKVPSALIAPESNILLNPKHPDFTKVKLISSEEMKIDRRLKK